MYMRTSCINASFYSTYTSYAYINFQTIALRETKRIPLKQIILTTNYRFENKRSKKICHRYRESFSLVIRQTRLTFQEAFVNLIPLHYFLSSYYSLLRQMMRKSSAIIPRISIARMVDRYLFIIPSRQAGGRNRRREQSKP